MAGLRASADWFLLLPYCTGCDVGLISHFLRRHPSRKFRDFHFFSGHLLVLRHVAAAAVSDDDDKEELIMM